MEIVSLVVFRQRIAGFLRIDDDLVEVDTPSKAPLRMKSFSATRIFSFSACSSPRTASRECVAERRKGRANDSQPMRMGARDQLLVSFDDRLGGRLRIMRRQAAAGPTDIIDAHHQDDRVRFRLTQTSESKRASALTPIRSDKIFAPDIPWLRRLRPVVLRPSRAVRPGGQATGRCRQRWSRRRRGNRITGIPTTAGARRPARQPGFWVGNLVASG